MDPMDKRVLELVKSGEVYWSRREGGSEPYQIHRARLHDLVVRGYVWEFEKKSCCYREYGLTPKGAEELKNG